ncbi:hypothetical protein IJ541_04105 [bacterium]|nr:hypothetical protein [bacterium]
MAIQHSKNLKLDNKRRITLGKIAPKEVTSYDVKIENNGVIILYPKVEIPAEELWLFHNKEAKASVKRGLDDAANNRYGNIEEEFWNDLED